MLHLHDLPAGTEVKIEQISHDFIFGAIFSISINSATMSTIVATKNFTEHCSTQPPSPLLNRFEPQPDQQRFKPAEKDTATYWNQVNKPKEEMHWRRPATDHVVAFCEQKGIRLHAAPSSGENRSGITLSGLSLQSAQNQNAKSSSRLGKKASMRSHPQRSLRWCLNIPKSCKNFSRNASSN